VGEKDAVRQQLTNMCDELESIGNEACPFKLVVNVEKVAQASLSKRGSEGVAGGANAHKTSPTSTRSSSSFSVANA
jgi:hypothetical protein